MQFSSLLRKKLKHRKVVVEGRRLDAFTGREAVLVLKEHCEDPKKELQAMIREVEIVRVLKRGNAHELVEDGLFDEAGEYVWLKPKLNPWSLILALLMILVVFTAIMFPVWPRKMRNSVSYAFYLILLFIGFMLVISVIRLIMFAVTIVTHPPGIWLFPNLYADCGVIESFIPLWSYHGAKLPKKKQDSKKSDDECVETNDGVKRTASAS